MNGDGSSDTEVAFLVSESGRGGLVASVRGGLSRTGEAVVRFVIAVGETVVTLFSVISWVAVGKGVTLGEATGEAVVITSDVLMLILPPSLVV